MVASKTIDLSAEQAEEEFSRLSAHDQLRVVVRFGEYLTGMRRPFHDSIEAHVDPALGAALREYNELMHGLFGVLNNYLYGYEEADAHAIREMTNRDVATLQRQCRSALRDVMWQRLVAKELESLRADRTEDAS